MRVLFVLSEVILSEPMGIMQLSAICKMHGHQAQLCVLRNYSLLESFNSFQPDIIAYGCMTADIAKYREADQELLENLKLNNQALPTRIMGGPHPTYFTSVLEEMNLDAICVGEGDFAILGIIDKLQKKKPLEGIPNILSSSQHKLIKQLPQHLDELPFIDRDIFYEAMPRYQSVGLRSFLTARGCAFNCSYCYVNSYNKMFKDVAPIVRRRSVDNLIQEIQEVRHKYPEMRLIRFADDTFIYRVDDWFLEFVDKYKRLVGLPFYCLMRSNVFTDEVARLLKEAGCQAISMSIESANSELRAKVLGRHIPDHIIKRSFNIAKKYNIKTYANTMLGIPGSTFQDDLKSFRFARDLKVSAPTYSIFCPYPNLQLTDYAKEKGLLDEEYDYDVKYGQESVLNCFTPKEKKMQVRVQHLGPIFTTMPKAFSPLFYLMIRLPFERMYQMFGALFEVWILSTKIFKNIYPRNPFKFALVLVDSLFYAHKTNRLKGLLSFFKLEGGANIKKGSYKIMEKFRP